VANRVVDIGIATIGMVLTAPIVLVAAAVIRLDGGPAFFRQERVGYKGRLFKVTKLRSMIVDADRFLDSQGRPLCERLTRFGRLIRKLSIDELPQLFSVVMGDMSLVGPRPILPMMLPYLTERERARLSVRPGLTGLAQIKGRNCLRWSRRFRYDIIYVRRQSFSLDMWIMWRTIVVMISGEGVAYDRNPQQVQDVLTRGVQRRFSDA
jgi:lipopolysaccharide/colanic/teichoic acid biosynthesis glycosyltransferase